MYNNKRANMSLSKGEYKNGAALRCDYIIYTSKTNVDHGDSWGGLAKPPKLVILFDRHKTIGI